MTLVICPHCNRQQYHTVPLGRSDLRCKYCMKSWEVGLGPFSIRLPMVFDSPIIPSTPVFDDCGASGSDSSSSSSSDFSGGGDFGGGGASGDF